jgi:serine/threonine protein kinase
MPWKDSGSRRFDYMTTEQPKLETGHHGLEAAHHLLGAELEDGWKVVKKIEKPVGATGGHFSVCYEVEQPGGKKAFLKALNLAKALNMPGDVLRQVEGLIKTFNFERDTLTLCRDKRLRRIAVAIADGKVQPSGSPYPVYYIIFELAEGDIRKQMSSLHAIDLAWTLRTLHQTAAGLSQLHTNGIAHQDLKPSNVLVFSPLESKVGDLGCADRRKQGSPRSEFPVAGDRQYAPPELLYNEIHFDDWDKRRLGCDFYLLGSLVTFLFTGVSINPILYQFLDQPRRPGFWPQDYRTVLPYVRDAFGQTIAQIQPAVPECVRTEIVAAIEELCDPDPHVRGHPVNREMHQFGLERYISLFNHLGKRAEMGLLRV